jgi:hypothetical protein
MEGATTTIFAWFKSGVAEALANTSVTASE